VSDSFNPGLIFPTSQDHDQSVLQGPVKFLLRSSPAAALVEAKCCQGQGLPTLLSPQQPPQKTSPITNRSPMKSRITPPFLPHTRSTSVAMGGFLMLPGNMSDSLDCLSCLEQHPVSNDSLPPQIYSFFSRYLKLLREFPTNHESCYDLAMSISDYLSGRPKVRELVRQRDSFRILICDHVENPKPSPCLTSSLTPESSASSIATGSACIYLATSNAATPVIPDSLPLYFCPYVDGQMAPSHSEMAPCTKVGRLDK